MLRKSPHIVENDISTERNWRRFAWFAALLTVVGIVASVYFLLRKWQAERRARQLSGYRAVEPLTEDIKGLSQAEVESHKSLGQNTELQAASRRTREQIIRDSILTIFNVNLAALSIVQLLLGRPLDALITLGVMVLNIGMNLFQVEFAQRRLRSVQKLASIQTTVIRDGMVQGVDPADIVVDDVMAVATGDQIMADGVLIGEGYLIVDESAISGDSHLLRKQPGDTVYAGSICAGGRAACRAVKIGDDRQIAKHLQVISAHEDQMTPIEKILNSIMRVLLVFVFLIGAGVVIAYFIRDPNLDPEVFADYVSVIFGIAPASLFFMVVLTYVAATADLAAKGALVHRSRSIESLAQTDVICFAKAGILTGADIEINPLSDLNASRPLSDSRIRQILGDFAASTSANNLIIQGMKASYSGSKRTVLDEAPFLSVYGWSAVVFDDEDLRGVYVLAEPALLEMAERREETLVSTNEKVSATVQQRVLSVTGRVGRLFRRGESQSDESEPATEQENDMPELETSTKRDVGETKEVDNSGGFFTRFRKRIDSMLDVVEVKPEIEITDNDEDDDKTQLVFAYSPDISAIRGGKLEPLLPPNLIPLCKLSYSEQIHPEVVDAIKDFVGRGVDIKIFTPDPPQATIDLFRKTDLETEQVLQLHSITGPELEVMSKDDLARAAYENVVFGQLTLQQVDSIIQVLRADGRSVALIGDRVSDMSAMREADLSIARRSSYQAVLNSADIVLLNDSPVILSGVFDRGQRIVNGLLDILKLNLTQVVYMLLLIVAIPLLARGFPMTGAQTGIIAFITIALPAIGLTLWADAGVQPTKNLRWLLVRFIGPAGFTMAVTGSVVFLLFLSRSGEMAYAQVGLMHVLVAMGLVLVILIKPPVRYRFWMTLMPGDLRPAMLALVGAFLFVAISFIPLLSELLKIEPLQEPIHYLIIGQATVAWVITVQFIWLIIPIGYRAKKSNR